MADMPLRVWPAFFFLVVDWRELNGFVCVMEPEEFGVSGNLEVKTRGEIVGRRIKEGN